MIFAQIVAALATVAIAAPQNYFYAAPYGAWPYGLARTVAAPIAAPIAIAPISHSKYHAQDVLGQVRSILIFLLLRPLN